MKKGCIVTLYGNSNYGNKLQNFAIQYTLEKYSLSIETIRNYNSNFPYIKSNLIIKILNRVKYFIKLIIPGKIYKNKNFKKFNRKYLKDSKKVYFSNENNQNLEGKYDFFIVGSDQVWNPYFGLKGNMRFLDSVNSTPKIAMSASFGVDHIPTENHDLYKKGLKQFKYISVREKAGQKIIENLTSRKDIITLLDPTMLLTTEEWDNIAKKTKITNNKKYILTYFLGNVSASRQKEIHSLANKNNWEILNLFDKKNPYYKSGPAEFIYLEKNAELICTDSFHSCVFAILMNTPFVVFDREDKTESMNSRIDTLLSTFKLEDRKYTGKLNNSCLKCDYTNSYKILEKEREKAYNFIEKSLKLNKN